MNEESPVPEDETRQCTKCKHGRIPVSHGRKTCVKCREKARVRAAAHAARREAERFTDLPLNSTDLNAEPITAVKGKRKAEDLPDVLQGMKKRFKKSYVAAASTSTTGDSAQSASSAKRDDTEYQSATAMYKVMKHSSRKSKKLHFHGSFSIVAKADTDNTTRARLVVDELRKIAKIPFEHDKPLNPVSGTSYRVAFKCTCLGATSVPLPVVPLLNGHGDVTPKPIAQIRNHYPDTTPTPTISTSSAPLKRKQSDLTAWAGLKPKKTDPEAGARCKGKVVVVVENDTTHVLGIEGQKVTVTIEH